MKKIFLLSAAIFALCACGEKHPIGDPLDIYTDYTLPQGGASAWAEDWIQEMHDENGSYFVYKPTQADFEWRYGAAQNTSGIDSIHVGDPQYVEPLLKFLDEIWLRHLSPEFKKELGIPYRVLLADKILAPGGTTVIEAKVTGQSIAFSGVNAEFADLTPAQKKAKMDAFNTGIWSNYYIALGLVSFPEEFFEVTDYKDTKLNNTSWYDYSSGEGLEYVREQGIIMDFVKPTYGPEIYTNWYTPYLFVSNGRTRDQQAFMNNILRRTDAQIAADGYLDYPRIARKWQILIDYFDELGIDVRAIANMTFE